MVWQENYKKWEAFTELDAELESQLEKIASDEKQLED